MSTDEQGRDRCCPACRYSFASVASLERADAPDFADIAAFAVDGDGVVAYSPRVAAQANFWLREAWRQCRG